MKRYKKNYYSLVILICFLFVPILSMIKDDLTVIDSKINLKTSDYSTKDVNYLIITIDNFYEALGPLAIWKTQKGLISKIITVEDIELAYLGKDRAEKIKNCIRDYYQYNNTRWVLLAGDIEHVPSRYVYTPEGFPYDGDYVNCDSYYSDLDNNWDLNDDRIWGSNQDNFDYHAEVYIGRLSAKSETEMEHLVENILNYEKNPPIGSWMTHALHAGAFINFNEDWNYNGEIDLVEADKNRYSNFLARRLPFNWSYITFGETSGLKTTDYPYNHSLTSLNLENVINNGASIGTIMAHGNPTGLKRMIWTVDYDSDGIFDCNGNPSSGGRHIDYADYPSLLDTATANLHPQSNKLGMYYLLGCSNGQFDKPADCVTEYFLKNAAIGCIGGSYVVWAEDNWTERMNGGWYSEGLCARFLEYLFLYNRPGQALALSKEDYLNDRINSGITAVEPLWENKTLKQFNLFGDPEIPIWLNIPKKLNVERVITGKDSNPSFLLEITANNLPIENVTVTITNGTELLWISKTNNTGIVEVPLPWNLIGELTITANKLNYISSQIPSNDNQSDEKVIIGFSIPILIVISFFSICIIIMRLIYIDSKPNHEKS